MAAPTWEYLVEVTLRTDAAGTERTFYFSTHGRATGPFESPAETVYLPRVVQPGTLQLQLYQPGRTAGRSAYGYGAIVLTNTDGGLDALIDYGFAGQPISILRGQVGAARSSFVQILSGTMDQPAFAWSQLTLRVRDKQYALDQAQVQTGIYAGSNSGSPLAGIEGTANDIKGRLKPLLYGKVSNVAPVPVNTDRYIFQASDVAAYAITAAYDNGKSLTAGADYSSQSDMETNAPAAGGYRAWPAGGCLRVGTKPAGQITCDVTQGAASSARTVAQLLQALALRAGLSAGEISSADVAALDAAAPYEVGIYIDDGRPVTESMDRIASSVGAWYGFDRSGVLRMGRLVAPTGAPAVTLDATNILSIDRLATEDPGAGVPAWKVTVNYWPAWTRQTSALDSTVSAARRAYIEQGRLAAVATDAAVKTQHPAASELVFNTLLTTTADAETEAARLLALYKVRRDRIRASVYLSDDLVQGLELGAVAQITLPRYGMDAGKLFALLGMTTDYARNVVTLDLWG